MKIIYQIIKDLEALAIKQGKAPGIYVFVPFGVVEAYEMWPAREVGFLEFGEN